MESEPLNKSAEIDAAHPVIEPGHTFASVTDKISAIVLTQQTPRFWYVGFAHFVPVGCWCCSIPSPPIYSSRVGLFGASMIPVAWGFAIVNFVWWIGIGHAGTLISAILLLLRQKWRQSINRFAEAMTLFAVACAGLFPLLHLGRPWYAYWLFPYPSTMGIQPQFRSPLVWDVFAVSTYFTISLLFWYVGLIPDLATCAIRRASALRVSPMAFWPWVGAARRFIGTAMRWRIFYWPALPRRWWFPSIPLSALTLPWPSSRVGTRRSFRLTSWRERFIPDSPWC